MMSADCSGWDLPSPFIHRVTAAEDDMDVFGHVNNAVYFNWSNEAVWAQWRADAESQALAGDGPWLRGMAVIRSEADYLGHVYAGDEIAIGVWITASDGRLRAERRYQMRRLCEGRPAETVFRARWSLACFDLHTRRPARMTPAIKHHYTVKPDVAAALAARP